ncbi:hypothetical protein ACFWDG_27160, partial [Peribacillus sp. NPDC060186]
HIIYQNLILMQKESNHKTQINLKKNKRKFPGGAFIHFDQGEHYTESHFSITRKKTRTGAINVKERKLLG